MEKEMKEQKEKQTPQEKKELEQKQEEIKKWKGKDWFAILAPEMFGRKLIAETPSTDPNFIIGRNVFTTLMDLTGNKNGYYMKLRFVVNSVENKNAYTDFNGLECIREYLTRFVRKRSDKIESVFYAETKDGFKLQINTLTIPLRKVDAGTKTQMRKLLVDYFISEAEKSSIEQFVKNVLGEKYRTESRAMLNKIYPTKFHEVAKVEVIKRPGK
jgi:ribosomal protein S3AE